MGSGTVSKEIEVQSAYWDKEASAFHAIYSHEKSEVSNLLDRVFRKDMYERFAFTMEHGAPCDGRSFLDVGCGSGLYSVEFAKRGSNRVVGIDIANDMLTLSRELAIREHVESQCSFIHSDLLEFESESPFDVCIGIGLFDYIRDPLPVLKRMREMTKGKVVVSFPRVWTWRAPIRKVRLALRRCAVFFYRRGRIEGLMHLAGFTRVDIHVVGKLYCVVGYVE